VSRMPGSPILGIMSAATRERFNVHYIATELQVQ
jgi:hypothetical protein